ncbi:Fasciculation and elongation protein zeta-2 [Portunus trituberculatus]|uniref:Fasciculation and elongation protein zeta-2 n=1 Tax=Portunus trituberculatus TaxID=210409 RepID=A0A5B7FC33_PORTR|nr:Fasciculation and elongation protein zeta-2 [Portunus trituberculatus]
MAKCLRLYVYLTTVIPYDVGHGPPHNPTLQILIKILTAINEDSPTVPTLLTDYILKGQCGSARVPKWHC